MVDLNAWRRRYALFLLCLTTAMVARAQTFTSLTSFDGTDGANPNSSLIQGTDGNFYGTTYSGGTSGSGTVFRVTSTGTLTTLYSFCPSGSCDDGQYPNAGLVQSTNGKFYGTTINGGSANQGTLFSITAGGKFTNVHSFCTQTSCADGSNPGTSLIQATDGNLYGTTGGGGLSSGGTIFEITTGGTLTTLYSFDGREGSIVNGGLVQATNGMIYGTSFYGGTDDDGTVFSLAIGLGPFVETLPATGKFGESVVILGNDLRGTTSVTFNGTQATFGIVSGSEIKTTVPAGASTGSVEVTTPQGALKSNVAFQVTD